MCLKIWNACKTNMYGYIMVVFAILWYQVVGFFLLLDGAFQHDTLSIFLIVSSGIISVGLGLMLSVSTLTRNSRVVLIALIIGVIKLILGVISGLIDPSQMGFTDFGQNWALLLILVMMQHGVYMYYKHLKTEKAMSSNRMLIDDAQELD